MSQEVATTQPRAPREMIQVTDPIAMFDTARFEHMQRIATVMARSSLVPESLITTSTGQGQNRQVERLPIEVATANCFLVVNQAVRWNMDPFAVAQCCSIVHGRLMTEGKLVHALVQAKIGDILSFEWNDKRGDEFGITVSGTPDAMGRPRTVTGTVGQWKTAGANSPWGKVQQHRSQLAYRGVREWCRLYQPALLLGVYTPDEMDDLQDASRSVGERRRSSPPPAPAVVAQREVPQIEAPKQEPAAATQDAEEAEIIEPEVVTQPEPETAPADEPAARTEPPAAAEKILWALTEALKDAIDEEDVETIYSDMDAEPELAEHNGYVEKARALKANRLAEIAKHAAPADPFVLPEFRDAEHFEAFLAIAREATTDKGTAEKLKATWADALAYGKRAKLPEDVLRRQMNACLEKMGEYLPRQERRRAPENKVEEPKPAATEQDFPLDQEPTTAAEYLALMRTRAKGADYATVKGYRGDYMAEASPRKRLGVPQNDLDPLKAALWARADELKG